MFLSLNNFKIRSTGYPDLNNESIYLYGNKKEKDLYIFSNSFESNEERDFYFNKLLFALKDWSENWEGFKEEKPKENNIYEF